MRPHTPVLLKEVIQGLSVAPGKRFIDATYGGGGHTREIRRLGGEVLGIDADPEAGVITVNFRDIEKVAGEYGFSQVDGILFDLGVSSHQLDEPGRGFSYRFSDNPLDLRMNQKEGESAAELLKHISENELYEILAKFSEEEHSRAIAARIVRARGQIVTTGDLARAVGGDNSTLSRVFQAIRIAVNDELGALRDGLAGAKNLLLPGGRLVVISFHSLEDRTVKQFLRTDDWKILTKKPIVASDQERSVNPRARSAKLRIAEKL